MRVGDRVRVFFPGEGLFAQVSRIHEECGTFTAELRNGSIHGFAWGAEVEVRTDDMEVIGPRWMVEKAEANVKADRESFGG